MHSQPFEPLLLKKIQARIVARPQVVQGADGGGKAPKLLPRRGIVAEVGAVIGHCSAAMHVG